jgi:hypothetical protein
MARYPAGAGRAVPCLRFESALRGAHYFLPAHQDAKKEEKSQELNSLERTGGVFINVELHPF